MKNWRRILGWLAAVVATVAVVGGSFVVGSGVAQAAGAERAARSAPATQSAAAVAAVSRAAAYGAPHEASKVVLPETSLDGPALWTQRGPSAPVGPMAVLAWTSTDSRLNYEYTNDGVHFFGKQTLNETSFVRPAVVRGTGEGGFVAPVALAWTGTDAAHHLNMLYAVPGAAPMKLTLWTDTSFTAPALEWLNGTTNTLLLAWAGTDAGHALNLLPVSITSHGLVAGTKTTLWSFHSLGQPALIHELPVPLSGPQFLLSWSELANQRIAWATSSDGTTWTRQPTFLETSGAAPSMMGLVEQLDRMPPYWLGWTGTDAAHHVNVLYALDRSRWTTSFVKATLPETAVGGTVVGFVLSPPDQQMLVAWTGTDAAHHLNVARVGV